MAAFNGSYRVVVLPDFVPVVDFLLSASIAPIRVSLRLQAARHSAFVMGVPRSQKFMQSARVFPPPLGALADASLALALPVRARLVRPGGPTDPGVPSDDDERLAGVPPLDKGVVVNGEDIEGSGASEGMGEPIAEDGSAFRALGAGLVGVGGGVCVAARDGL